MYFKDEIYDYYYNIHILLKFKIIFFYFLQKMRIY